MLDLELFVSTDAYENRISQIDGYLTSLNMVLSEYNGLNGRIGSLITGEDDSDILPELRSRAEEQINAIKTQINYAMTCKAQLQKTLDTMKDAGTSAQNILKQGTEAAKNTVGAMADAAKTAAAVAEVAAIL